MADDRRGLVAILVYTFGVGVVLYALTRSPVRQRIVEAIEPLVPSHEDVRQVLDRARAITKQAATEKGVES